MICHSMFALGVLQSPPYRQCSHHRRVPAQYVCWLELAYVQLVAPRASLLCHLAGILAGLLHVRVTGVRMRWPRPVLGVFRGRANLAGPRCGFSGHAGPKCFV